MNNLFYSKLAFQNLRKNRSLYLPCLLSGAVIVMLFYVLDSICVMLGSAEMRGASYLELILGLSRNVCGFLSIVILFYINSFVMKQRKREFGLFCVLGMEKQHLFRVLFLETTMVGVGSILLGIIGGALFSQLLFLVLLNLVQYEIALEFMVPLSSIGLTAAVFAAAYLLVVLAEAVQIIRTNPIDLLHSSKVGEREPKARWLLALLGAVSLGSGYALAIGVKSAAEAIMFFIVAVILVIIGTYLLFTAGSIAVLKIMRRNKSFYYKPNNFVSVSGMIYRMKQNAMGLANICILSTCVLVTLSSTICLYIGAENITANRFPRDVITNFALEDGTEESAVSTIENLAEQHGLEIKNAVKVYPYSLLTYWDGQHSFSSIRSDNMTDISHLCDFQTLPLSSYNEAMGMNYQLREHEVLLNQGKMNLNGRFQIDETEYKVKGLIPYPDFLAGSDDGNGIYAVMVMRDDERQKLWDTYHKGENTFPWFQYVFDVDGAESRRQVFQDCLREALVETKRPSGENLRVGSVSSRDVDRKDFYEMFGGLFFVGIFFTLLFLLATVLIVYYKQITEGFDDHDRFHIMQQVGMSPHEVKSAIHKQVLMVFFLPLGLAMVHIAAAFPALCKILQGFQMTNVKLFVVCVLGTCLFFSIVYLVIYWLTANVYYRLAK